MKENKIILSKESEEPQGENTNALLGIGGLGLQYTEQQKKESEEHRGKAGRYSQLCTSSVRK